MTNRQKPNAPLSRPSRVEEWLRRLLFSSAELPRAPGASAVFGDAVAGGGFRWLNHAGPLSEDELRVLSFLSVGM